ncbi:MAG: hypothetical protein IJZ57_09115 [Clostridia bacterium]|nr:hypothetical protein [Clostridia bacterium]
MKDFAKGFLLLINILSFIGVAIFGVIGVLEELIGPIFVDNLMEAFNFSLTYNQFYLIGLGCLAVMIISYFIRKKL